MDKVKGGWIESGIGLALTLVVVIFFIGVVGSWLAELPRGVFAWASIAAFLFFVGWIIKDIVDHK